MIFYNLKKYKKYYQWKLAMPIILLNSRKQSKPKQIIFADRKNIYFASKDVMFMSLMLNTNYTLY